MDATGRQQGWDMPDHPPPTSLEELPPTTPVAKSKAMRRQMPRDSQHLAYDEDWNPLTPEPSAKKQLGLGLGLGGVAEVDDEAIRRAATRIQAVTRGTLTRWAYEDERRREWIGYYVEPDVAQYEEALRLCVDERERAMVQQAAATGVPMEALAAVAKVDAAQQVDTAQSGAASRRPTARGCTSAAASAFAAQLTMPQQAGGWEEVHDPEVGVYFFNEATGASQWERPTAAVVAAPQPATSALPVVLEDDEQGLVRS